MLSPYLSVLIEKLSLSKEQSQNCLSSIFSGKASLEEIKALLTLLKEKGESVEEIVGFATAMREAMVRVRLSTPAMDLCGTGGSSIERFNVSTSAAFILAAGGVPVAKHGNVGSRKENGSFNFLEALNIPFHHSVETLQHLFEKTSLCFLFARRYHIAMRHVSQARQELGFRTIFNLLGPLCNPALVPYQIIGTPSQDIGKKLAKAIQLLGTHRALIIVGGNGLDELANEVPSLIFEVTRGSIEEKRFDPSPLHLRSYIEDSRIGNASRNAALFVSLFTEKNSTDPIVQNVCLNAGAAFYCFGTTPSIEEGYHLARDFVRNGSV